MSQNIISMWHSQCSKNRLFHFWYGGSLAVRVLI